MKLSTNHIHISKDLKSSYTTTLIQNDIVWLMTVHFRSLLLARPFTLMLLTVPFRLYSSVNQSNNFLLLAFSQNKSPRGGFEFERIKLRTLCHYRPCSYFQIFLTRGINWWDFISQFVTKNKGMRWLNFKFCMCVLVTVEVSKVVTCKLFCCENIFFALFIQFNEISLANDFCFYLRYIFTTVRN